MSKYRLSFLCLVLLSRISVGGEMVQDYPIQPVAFTEVRIQDEFWSKRLETNRAVTIPYAFEQCEKEGRIDNFLRAAGKKEGDFTGVFPFNDTDVYKILEGASYSLQVHPDPELDAYLDKLIAIIGEAQEEDGYIYTVRTINRGNLMNWTGKERWSNLGSSHELYNSGHLFEAAAAHYLATGKRTLLDIALKNADLLCATFGPDKRRETPGHQVVEMGLARLYRITGEEKYLQLAKFFLDERGRTNGRKLRGAYSQDHKPVTEQDEAVGHAVRAAYMYAGMADIAALSGDTAYREALDEIWDNIVSRKMHLTGGIGSRADGEAFGDHYELPNHTAYNETCAAIGHVYLNHRMFLFHGDGKYMDVLERTLYNGVLSGVSLEGDRFFYPNPLAAGPNGNRRSPWFDCSCCPSNVARFIPSIPGYMYAVRDDSIYVNLYAGSQAGIPLGDGHISIIQKTNYPWDGKIIIEVDPVEEREFALLMRIPGWAREEIVPSNLYESEGAKSKPAVIKVNGKKVSLAIEKGYARIQRQWKKGDSVTLELPMAVQRITSNPQVKDNLGRMALQRGPLVYCAEWVDNDGHITDQFVPEGSFKPKWDENLLNGVTLLQGKAKIVSYKKDGKNLQKKNHPLTLIPYYAWAHREPGEMAVWLAREESAAQPQPFPTLASTSKVTYSFKRRGGESLLSELGINDQILPKSSSDQSVPRFHWWPRLGTQEWIQYDFEKPATVQSISVYWFDDTGRGACRAPQSWRLLYKDGEDWKEVATSDQYGVELNAYNTLTFPPVRTDALRIEVQCKPEFSAGILEWKVE